MRVLGYICSLNISINKHGIWKQFIKDISYFRHIKILGIETSCDDTGCAIVDGSGKILGESLYSQNKLHVKFGGINPLIARDLHRDNIESCVKEALNEACLDFKDIDGIAVTVKPGLLTSLEIGFKYAKYLSKTHNKPLIPIHHMEAHALVARMFNDISIPFLTVLISGGHSLLALVKDINEFLLLGETLDNSPGEVLDKAARRMKLRNIKEYSTLAGGKAIEIAAEKSSNPYKFKLPLPLARNRDCNFSFSGLQDAFLRHLINQEQEHNICGDGIIPEVNDLCAALQLAIAEHIAHRTERAVLFCQNANLINVDSSNIVVSGGVACNNVIFKCIQGIGKKLNCEVYRPPSKLCTDNGVMIAWNAIERLKKGLSHIVPDKVDPNATLGESIINEVKAADLHVKVTRLKHMNMN